MKVLITKVTAVEAEYRVDFECEYGNGSAIWEGRPPSVGEPRHVELEIDGVLTIGKEVTETSEPVGILIEQQRAVLVGEVTIVDDDGYARMEIGCAGVDLEIVGDQLVLGRRYRVVAPNLKAFDCDY